MNKNIIGIVVFGGVVLLGGWWYMSNQQSLENNAMMEDKAGTAKEAMQDKAMMEQEAMMQQPAGMMEKPANALGQDQPMMMKGGQYVAYDTSKLAFAKEGKVVLFFRASWCPSCRALDADIKKNASQIPQNILILDVDYDKYADLKKQYGITSQHTLVQVDAMGNMITKWSGSEGLSDLVKQVQ